MIGTGIDCVAITTTVTTVAEINNYTGPNDVIVLKDALRGGVFVYDTSALTIDNGTVFEATGRGSGYWRRLFNPEEGLNVLWYGADPTGTDDNADIIESLINEYSVNNSKIFFPNGTYAISRPLGDLAPLAATMLITHDVSLIGESDVTITYSGATQIPFITGFECTGAVIRCENITFDGNNLANRGIYWRQADNTDPAAPFSQAYFKNVPVKNISGTTYYNKNTGITFYGKWYGITLDNVSLDTMTTSSGNYFLVGISINGASGTERVPKNVVLKNMTVSGLSTTSTTHSTTTTGIELYYIGNLVIDNVTVDGSESTTTTGTPTFYGIDLNSCSNIMITRCNITNLGNETLGNAYGMRFVLCTDFQVSDKNTIDNLFTGSGITRGIIVTNNNNASTNNYNGNIYGNIIKNIIGDNDADGIQILQLGIQSNMTVHDNYFENCYKRAVKLQAAGCSCYSNRMNFNLDGHSFHSAISSYDAYNKIYDNIVYSALGSIAQVFELQGSDNEFYDNKAYVAEISEDWINIGSASGDIDNIRIYGNNLTSPAGTNGLSQEYPVANLVFENNRLNGEVSRMLIEVLSKLTNATIRNNKYKGTAPTYPDFITHTDDIEGNIVIQGNDVNVTSRLYNTPAASTGKFLVEGNFINDLQVNPTVNTAYVAGPSAATLNSDYPIATNGFRVIAPNVGSGGAEYIKHTSGWTEIKGTAVV